jgi:predicted NBD/HSP70 family sugar kinase
MTHMQIGLFFIKAVIFVSHDPALGIMSVARSVEAFSSKTARPYPKGDAASLKIIQDSGHILGEVLTALVNFHNPALIVIGGSQNGYQFLSRVRQGILRRSPPGTVAGVQGGLALALAHPGEVPGYYGD